MGDKTLGITTDMDISDIQEGLNEIASDLGDLPETYNIDLNLTGDASVQVEALMDKLDELKEETVDPKADLTGTAQEEADNLRETLTDIGNTNTTANVNVDGNASSELGTLEDQANQTASDMEEIGTAAETSANDIDGAMADAEGSVNTLGDDTQTTSSDVADLGDTGEETGDELVDSFNEATIAVGLLTAGATEAQGQLYNTAITVNTLAEYTGLSYNNTKDLVSSLVEPKFDTTTVENYLDLLHTLGVSNDKLKENAEAMNTIQLGTNSSAETTMKYAQVIKELGLNVSDMAEYQGMAGYIYDKTAGHLDTFTTAAARLGPKLEAMGFSGEESAVIIADLAQKYGGNMRAMSSAVTGAKGNGDALLQTLGITRGEVDSDVDSFSDYNQKVQDTADYSRKNVSATEDWKDRLEKLELQLGTTGAALMNFGIAAGAIVTGWGITKLLDKILPGETDIAGKYAKFWKDLFHYNSDLVDKWKNWWHSDEAKIDIDVPMKYNEDLKGYEADFSKISNFVGDAKTKLGELKESNVWKMLFGDEKGSLNFNVLDQAETRIVSFVDNAKTKLGELKDSFNKMGDWGSLLSDAETSGREFSYLTEDFDITKYPYLTTLSQKTDEELSSVVKTVADKTTLLKEVGAEFGRDYGNIIDTSARIIDGSYEGLERTCKVHLDNIKYSDELTSIEEEMKVFRERYAEELKGVEEDTTSFFDDEEGRIKGFNLDDLVNKVSSVKNRINEFLDEGYEHYYGDNNKAVESNSETLEKVTSKVETTKNKITGILNDGYEHYYGDTKSFLDDEDGRISTNLSDISSKISNFVDNAKSKLGELKDSIFDRIFSDEKGTVTAAEGKVSSFVDDAKVKIGELDGYDVYDKVFKDTGEGDTALSKISGLVDNIKLKVADLDGSNVYNKVFGSGTPESTTTEEPVTPKVGETTGSDTISNIQEGANRGVSKFTETGGSIIDKIVEGAKKVTLPSAGEIVDGLFNGLKTSISLGSARATGMSLATTFFDFLKPAASLGGSDMFAFMGMDLPGNPLWNLENNQPLIDWDPINQMKADLANAGNKNVKGSLADQLNLPGWIKGQEPEINSALNGLEDSIKSHLPKMPNILGDLGNIKLPSLSSIESGIGSELNGLKSYITSHIPKMPNILGDLSKIKLPSLSSIESGIGSEFNSLKTYVTSHLPKVPTINWNTLGNGLGGVVTKAENTYNGLKSYVLSHVPKIPIPTWSNVSQGLSGIVSTAESEYGGLKSYVISHIPKVPIPSWSNIRSGLPGAVKTAEDDLRGLESFVGGVPGKLYSLGNQIGERFAAGIRSAEGDVNSALQWLKDRLPASPPKTGPLAGIKAENMQSWASGIAHAGVSGFSAIESGISSTLGSAVSTAESELNKIEGTVTGFSGEMESTASHLWSIGESMVANLSGGLSAGLPDLSSVFSRISNMFPHSPPKEGPLASVKAENMKAWTKNIAQAGVEGLSRFTGYMDEMVQLPKLSNLSTPGLTKAINSPQNSPTVINLTVAEGAVVIQGNADENVVKNAGAIFGESAAEKLARQGNNRGYSTINVIR